MLIWLLIVWSVWLWVPFICNVSACQWKWFWKQANKLEASIIIIQTWQIVLTASSTYWKKAYQHCLPTCPRQKENVVGKECKKFLLTEGSAYLQTCLPISIFLLTEGSAYLQTYLPISIFLLTEGSAYLQTYLPISIFLLTEGSAYLQTCLPICIWPYLYGNWVAYRCTCIFLTIRSLIQNHFSTCKQNKSSDSECHSVLVL